MNDILPSTSTPKELLKPTAHNPWLQPPQRIGLVSEKGSHVKHHAIDHDPEVLADALAPEMQRMEIVPPTYGFNVGSTHKFRVDVSINQLNQPIGI